MPPIQDQHQKRQQLMVVLLAGLVGFLFAFKTLAAIPLTSLWNDELRTVEKAFQPSLGFLFQYLRGDVHPPLYYVLIWGSGKLFGETVAVLRSFSWVCYLLGAAALALASWSWGGSQLAAALAGVLGLALPFTVRYAVEGKAYALLYALIALAIGFRIRLIRNGENVGLPYAVCWSAAALTHYYGLGLLLCQAALDWRRGRPAVRPLAWALVAPTLWMLANLSFLLGSGGRDWIPPASLELLWRLLRLGLGPHWPAVLIAGVLVVLVCWSPQHAGSRQVRKLMADWGLDAGLLLLAGSFLVSMLKPSAIDRYYIVLVPAAIGVSACWLGARLGALKDPGQWRRALVVMTLSFLLLLFWADSYHLIVPSPRSEAHRKGNDFRLLAMVSASAPLKFSPQCRQLNAYDHVLVQEHLLQPQAPWECLQPGGRKDGLAWGRQVASSAEKEVVLAITGRKITKSSFLDPYLLGLEARGFRCELASRSTRFAKVFHCQLRDQS